MISFFQSMPSHFACPACQLIIKKKRKGSILPKEICDEMTEFLINDGLWKEQKEKKAQMDLAKKSKSRGRAKAKANKSGRKRKRTYSKKR